MSEENRNDLETSRFRDRSRAGGRTVTVEVRRKKMSLLERKKALQGGHERTKAASKKKEEKIPNGLTREEFDSRIKALQTAQRTAQEKSMEAPEVAEPVVETAPQISETRSVETPSLPETPAVNNEGPIETSEETVHQSAAKTGPVIYRVGVKKTETKPKPSPKSNKKASTEETPHRAEKPKVETQKQEPVVSVTKSSLPERKFLGPEVRKLESANYSGEIRPRSSLLRSGSPRTGRSVVRKEIEVSQRSVSSQGSVVLRAEGYGPRPAQRNTESRQGLGGRDRSGERNRGEGDYGKRSDERANGGRRGAERSSGNGTFPRPRRDGTHPLGARLGTPNATLTAAMFENNKGEGRGTPARTTRKRASADFEGDSARRSRRSNNVSDGRRKLSRHVLSRVMEDEEEARFRSEASYRRAQKKRLGSRQTTPTKVIRTVMIPETISVGELSNRMAVSSAVVIKALMKLGTLASINQIIDADTAELICVEFGHRPKRISENTLEQTVRRSKDRPEDLQPRPPVVTVMGHVDHGKTSLLDALRKTDMISTEFGGITQHIGAYQIITPFSDAKITFLDTPGHAAFSAMRERGANVTDIVVLVVAADDSVNVQTIEAIQHAKAAGAPMIVAINKIDKPTADPQRIKNELLNHEVVLEDFGGDIMAVEISAKKGINLDKLVEAILLQAEVLELKANPKGAAEGVIIEASIAKGRGIVATVLVRKGTLKPGDIVVAGTEIGRIKTMHDYRRQKVQAAEPSCPVEVLGFNGVPMAGDELLVVESEQIAREIAEQRQQALKSKEAFLRDKNSIADMMSHIAQGEKKTLNVVLKADTQGSVEAIIENIRTLSVEEVEVSVIHGAVGDINETDMMLAKSAKGKDPSHSQVCVVGFNVKATPQAKVFADRERISIGYYTIVYELFEAIHKLMKGLTAPKFEERVLGQAELRMVFSKGKTTKIAGCYVTSGLIRRANTQLRVLRGKDVVFTGKIDTMRHEKDDIKEAKEGHECGIILEGFNDLKVGDILECFEKAEIQAR